MFNRKLEVKLVKDSKNSTPDTETTPIDYFAVAEEAAEKLVKKLVIGTCAVVAVHVIAKSLGTIAVNALAPKI